MTLSPSPIARQPVRDNTRWVVLARRWLARCFAAWLLCLAPALAASAENAASAAQSHPGETRPLLLQASAGTQDLWERAEVLADPEGRWSATQALQHLSEFAPPGRLGANLGKRKGAVWIHLPVQVPARAPTQGPGPAFAAEAPASWVLNIDYPSLDVIDVHVLADQRLHTLARLGDHVPMAQRPTPSRAHTVNLSLVPGQTYQLLLRVQTTGSMLVPLQLQTPAAHALGESREQALQGLFAGAGLCLLFYCLTQWVSLRQALFGWYALSLGGMTAFFGALSGSGAQHVWGASLWLTQNGPPFFILIGIWGGLFFVLHALQVDRVNRLIARTVQACGLLAAATAALFAAGVLDYGSAQAVGMALGVAPPLLVLPVAFKRLRAGDPAARWLLMGWVAYSFGVIAMVGVLRGWLPLNFWTLHAYQMTALIEMATWLAVLAEKVQAVRHHAAVVQQQQEYLHSPNHTDALTALLNRNGLHAAMPARLVACSLRQPLALFLIELHGLQDIVDAQGRDAGNEVLTTVAKRLRAHARNTDLLCRLGEKEFVLVVSYLSIDAAREAEAIGHKLLQVFDQPFGAGGKLFRLGLTIGFAMAPNDDRSLNDLLQRAQAGTEAGRQTGRSCVRRGGVSVALPGN